MSLFEQLQTLAMQQAAPQAAQRAGIDQSLAEKLMPMAMTALMGGLKKNVSTENGAASLASALDRHDGGIMDNLSSLTEGNTLADGQKILGHILGGKQGQTTQALAKTAGVKESQMGELLAMAAPLLMGALGQQKRTGNLDISALTNLVSEEGAKAQTAAPSAMDGLMSFIDQDGDGDFKDDLLEQAGKQLLGGLFGRK